MGSLLRPLGVGLLIVLYLVQANTEFIVPDVVFVLLISAAGLGDLVQAATSKAKANLSPKRPG